MKAQAANLFLTPWKPCRENAISPLLADDGPRNSAMVASNNKALDINAKADVQTSHFICQEDFDLHLFIHMNVDFM